MCVSGNARKRFVVVVETEVKHDKPSTPVTEVGGEMNNHTVTKFRELEMDKNTIYNSAAVSMSEFSDLLSWANESVLEHGHSFSDSCRRYCTESENHL